jgi:uncharacterized protein (TIGR02246 family)
MHYQSLLSSCCLIGAGLLCGQAHAADDATTACNAAISAYGAAAATGDPAKMAAVYAPDGEVVSPYGFISGHDALVKFYASFMKPGDKEGDTSTSARMIATWRCAPAAIRSRRPRPHPARKASGRRSSAKWTATGRF